MHLFTENTVVLIRKHNRPLKSWGSTHAQPPLNATDRAVLSPVPLDSKPSIGAAIHSSGDLASSSGGRDGGAGGIPPTTKNLESQNQILSGLELEPASNRASDRGVGAGS
jgi:hypothetical protein